MRDDWFAKMDFELCNIDWTYEEFQVIRDICEKQCLTTSQVMKQALRTYQLVATGHSKLVEVNPIHKKSVEKCTCHERDSSYVCEFCYSQGYRGHMQK